ncbi:MAG TPA: UDP-N-acetylglucosamine 2-epimerase [Lentimicrobium sp.]|nr:UDP-N-acetylglucosamine 2-epimerase [Lentimicrobium sp.]
MKKEFINLGILTSSRADFGIYEPLIRALCNETSIKPYVIAFGTHLAERYGNSIQHIKKIDVPIIGQFDTAPVDDTPAAITKSMIKTMQSMIPVWEKHNFDLVLALGDRYEMFAAVASGLPFNIKFGHIHGGETTTGAIDNAMRHSISHMSYMHFTSSEFYKERVIELTGNSRHVYNTGALSVDNLASMNFISREDIWQTFRIDLEQSTILITIHPETIGYEKNEAYASEVVAVLKDFNNIQQVITMPNADTSGLIIRNILIKYAEGRPNVRLIENFGSNAYLSVMKYSSLILGNSSSGFIEAAWFPKWVINLGNRQGGRFRTPNIIDVPFNRDQIREAITKALESPVPNVEPVYGDGSASQKIIKHILDEFIDH